MRRLYPTCGMDSPGHTEECADLRAVRRAAHERVTEMEFSRPAHVRRWSADYWFASDGDA